MFVCVCLLVLLEKSISFRRCRLPTLVFVIKHGSTWHSERITIPWHSPAARFIIARPTPAVAAGQVFVDTGKWLTLFFFFIYGAILKSSLANNWWFMASKVVVSVYGLMGRRESWATQDLPAESAQLAWACDGVRVSHAVSILYFISHPSRSSECEGSVFFFLFVGLH